MPDGSAVAETVVSPDGHEPSSVKLIFAVICLIWYCVVTSICSIGYVQLWRFWSSPRQRAKLDFTTVPHITVIRPIKGLEPRLYDCLASTFRQDYPVDKLHIRFCISDRNEPSYPILKNLLRDFPNFDAQVMIEEEDEALNSGRLKLGPNPKIRNMTRAYREAIGDVVWIIDCNIWVARGVCGRMVAELEGTNSGRRHKFVHLAPMVVDVEGALVGEEARSLLNNGDVEPGAQIRTTDSGAVDVLPDSGSRTIMSMGGGRLEETFMASSHSKMYVAFQTVLVAPCIVGKSTMFRRSHIGSLTENLGIDYFSENICEDHLIGDLLWKKKVPEERSGEKMGKHALCFGDFAVQPTANMHVGEFWSRRARWLRVRKFTVTLATLVEPGIESYLCSLYGAYAVTTLPFFHQTFAIPHTWSAFMMFWLVSVTLWCITDRILYLKIHSMASIEVDHDTPSFARPPVDGIRRSFGTWFLSWLGRESLAFPIWSWAVYGGTEVEWRGRRFRVGMDTKVHEVGDGKVHDPNAETASAKARRD